MYYVLVLVFGKGVALGTEFSICVWFLVLGFGFRVSVSYFDSVFGFAFFGFRIDLPKGKALKQNGNITCSIINTAKVW